MILKCACCGGNAPGKQWWNQDSGFGVCVRCAVEMIGVEGQEEVEQSYGKRGIHWDMENTGVTRYVLTYINKNGMRQRFGPMQGRCTRATRKEAEEYLAAVLSNNSEETLKKLFPKLQVRPCECWPVHFDPKGCYFK